jgi:hypothetical protein
VLRSLLLATIIFAISGLEDGLQLIMFKEIIDHRAVYRHPCQLVQRYNSRLTVDN